MKLKWNKPKKTSLGKYVKSTYIYEDNMQEFWKIWNNKKEDIKKYGFSINKCNDKWKLNYWSDDNDIDIINKNCYKSLNDLGFIEEKKKNNKNIIKNKINSDLIKIEKCIKNLNFNDGYKEYIKFDKLINTKLKTIYFDYIKNRFYVIIKYNGNENIDNLIKFSKDDTKNIKKDLKNGILYKNCNILFLGYWIDNNNNKIYNIDY